MEKNPFDTSFIPEQPKISTSESKKRQVHSINVALVLALIFFFASVSTAAGMYFYADKIAKRIAQKEVQLAEMEKNIDLDGLRELQKIDRKLETAKRLLGQHSALSPLLDFMQENTLKNIGYVQFGFSNANNRASFSAQAKAPNYNAVYVQEQRFIAQKEVQRVTLGNPSLDEKTGDISFTFSVELDPAMLSYRKYFTDKVVSSGNSASASLASTTIQAKPATP